MHRRHLSMAWLAVLPPLFWAGNTVLGRAVSTDIPPIALSFWRWTLALLILLPFAWRRLRGAVPLLRAHWPILVVLSVLGVTNFNSLLYVGLTATSATNALLLGSATPLMILALSRLLFGQHIGLHQGVGMALSLAGVLLILVEGDPARLAALLPNAGDLWVLAAGLDWALYSVLLRRRPAGLDALTFLTVTVLIGTIPLAALYAWDLWQGHRFAVDLPNLAALGYVAIFPSVLAYIIWNRAVGELGANRIGQYMHLMPAAGALLAFLLLGEHPRWFHALGFIAIGTGLWLASRPPPARA